ncbi:MAG: hypothetical protein A2Y38_11665 [Spirochaetes bacterium GWB1_59_5]|nr:MAG: hypothetical protein A2Y38_11665 [Spirochaetes bacterium GWB1_59_5]
MSPRKGGFPAGAILVAVLLLLLVTIFVGCALGPPDTSRRVLSAAGYAALVIFLAVVVIAFWAEYKNWLTDKPPKPPRHW